MHPAALQKRIYQVNWINSNLAELVRMLRFHTVSANYFVSCCNEKPSPIQKSLGRLDSKLFKERVCILTPLGHWPKLLIKFVEEDVIDIQNIKTKRKMPKERKITNMGSNIRMTMTQNNFSLRKTGAKWISLKDKLRQHLYKRNQCNIHSNISEKRIKEWRWQSVRGKSAKMEYEIKSNLS